MEGKLRRLSSFSVTIVVLVIIGVLFRTINYERAFMFAHDQDLYSWIAKDIIVNSHNRLVGQVTSVDGVFIGSFYYYLMALFYLLFNMDPISAVIPVTLIGIFNAFSFYWVINRHFGKKSAIVAMFLYVVSFGIARFDRWSVPTQPTFTWAIWFIEVILELMKGNLKALPLYAFLTAFIWQLHIALLPVIPIPIMAYFIGKNKLSNLWSKEYLKLTIASVFLFMVCLSPFLVFEIKHNFSQVKSIVAASQKDLGGPSGKMKLLKVANASGREFQQRLFFGYKNKNPEIYWLGLMVMSGILIYRKKIKTEQIIVFSMWYGLILLAQFTSKRVVSEYYFTNMVPIYIIIMSIFLSEFIHKKILYLMGLGYLVINGYWLVTRTDEDESYLYHRMVVEYIKEDTVKNNYPCIAVNYISDPGVGVGFRYLFWLNKIDLVKPGTPAVPVYNIPIPWQLSMNENPAHFGRFGVLLPSKTNSDFGSVCKDPNYQLEPMLGYTE